MDRSFPTDAHARHVADMKRHLAGMNANTWSSRDAISTSRQAIQDSFDLLRKIPEREVNP